MRSFSFDQLESLLGRFPSISIAVLGDYFLDKYLEVEPKLAEDSIETGKVAHQVVSVRTSPGAAGTVVNNLSALGAGRIFAAGFTGDDGESYDLRKGLEAIGCEMAHLHRDESKKTPTYLKPRDRTTPGLEGEHSRYDTKNREGTGSRLEDLIIASMDVILPQIDAIVIMDQVEELGSGVVTPAIVEAVADRAHFHRRVVFWADSRRRIGSFRNVIIKPNQFEAVGMSNPPDGRAVPVERLEREIPELRARANAQVFVTAGERGMYVSDPELTLVPGLRLVPPLDTTGAGDSATAGCVMSLAAGAEASHAALIGNLTASVTVRQLDTTGTASPDDLRAAHAMWQEQRG